MKQSSRAEWLGQIENWRKEGAGNKDKKVLSFNNKLKVKNIDNS